MKTVALAVLVVASLATAANAAAPDPDECRQSAGLVQGVADALNKSVAGRDRSSVVNLLFDPAAIDQSALDSAMAAQGKYYEAMAAFRDAMDALSAEIRACKPKE